MAPRMILAIATHKGWRMGFAQMGLAAAALAPAALMALAALGFIAWTALRRAFGRDRLPGPPSSE